jgi:hypothetical protein
MNYTPSLCKSVYQISYIKEIVEDLHTIMTLNLGDNTSADDSCIVGTYMSTGSIIHYRDNCSLVNDMS